MTSRSRLAAVAIGASAAVAGPASVMASSYVVHPGDTLSDIAVRHGTTLAALVQANDIHNVDLIQIGQLLHIPDGALGLPAYTRGAADAETHLVRSGEGLIHIAGYFGLDPTALARANGIGVNAPLHTGAILTIPGRLQRANALLVQVAGEVGIDPELLKAVAWQESHWQQHVISATGAVGMLQIEPYTGDWVSTYLAKRRINLRLASDNVRGGALLLKHLLQVHNGDVRAVLAGYYQGDGSIARHGLYEDTRQYQADVLRLMREG